MRALRPSDLDSHYGNHGNILFTINIASMRDSVRALRPSDLDSHYGNHGNILFIINMGRQSLQSSDQHVCVLCPVVRH